jgi:hypothetical protein
VAALEGDPLPAGTIVPTLELPPAIPFTSQAIAELPATQKEAAKVFVCASVIAAEEGTRELPELQVMVTTELPDMEGSATLAAVTVTLAGEGTTAGATYMAVAAPVETIVPVRAPPPEIPFTLQVTPCELPETDAVRTCAPLVATVTAAGETVTVIVEGAEEDDEEAGA